MKLTLKHIPIGSTLELGGDTMKRRLYLGELSAGFGVLYKNKDDFNDKKPWVAMVEPSHKVKNVQLPTGFDIENIVGWARGMML